MRWLSDQIGTIRQRRKEMRKVGAIVFAIVFFFVCSFAVFAGGQSEATAKAATMSATAKTKIVWVEWWKNEWSSSVMDKLVSGFEAKYPNVTVDVIDHNWWDTHNTEIAMAQAGTQQDVLGMEGVWMSTLDKLGMLENLGPWLDKEGAAYKDRFVGPALVKYRGEIKAIYIYVYPFAVAYNPPMLKAAGLQPATSLTELISQLKTLTDPKKNVYGASLALSSDAAYQAMMTFGLFLAQYGGQFENADGTAAFNSPAGVKALDYMKSLVDQKVIVPDPLAQTAKQTREYFAANETPYTFDGPFITTITKQANPDLTPAYTPPMTTAAGGYVVSGSGLSMSAKSQHKQEAWDFIKYMMSDPVASMMVKVTGLPWGIKSMASDPFVQSSAVLSQAPAMIQNPNSILFPVIPNADKVQTAFINNIQAAVQGQKSVQQALSDAADSWNSLVK